MIQSRERGVTLVDSLVGIALLVLIFVGISGVFRLAVDVVSNNKARSGAIALANQRMEYIRSLTYASLGTIGGVPAGAIPQSETSSLNGLSYTRRTVIEYMDDPKDGTGVADTNSIAADSKIAKVDVSWSAHRITRHVMLVTRVSPPTGLEANPCTGPCGTLVINVVTASSTQLSGAAVSIVNASTSPAININTFTNASGTVTILGAPAAAGYQIVASQTGYSTARTYSVSAQNTNPNPGNLTVGNNLTTSGTFAIDRLSQKTVNTWTQILSGTWSEPFTDTNNISTSTHITVSGASAQLIDSGGYPAYGEFQSIAILPSNLNTWQRFSASTTTPPGTNIRFYFLNSAGGLIPDAQLPGNSAGFATTSVDLSGVSTTTNPSLRVDAVFTTTNASNTPIVRPYTVSYTYGPLPLPNIAFTLQGGKTIGSGPSGTLYKYSQVQNTGSAASVAIPNLEWDTYIISVDGAATGYDVASACQPQPEILLPNISQIDNLFLTAHTANSLLVDVRSAASGALLPNATISLSRSGYSATSTTDTCGQAFFSSLSSASNYTINVSASGFTTYNASNVSVSGTTKLSIPL